MLLAIFFSVLLFLSSSGSDKDLIGESKSQAKYYITQIENGRSVDESLWALSLLGTENPTIQNFIEEESQKKKYTARELILFKKLEDSLNKQLEKIVFNTGSSNLLIALLLSVETKKNKEELYQQFANQFKHPNNKNIDYDSLCRFIIDGKQINTAILPNNRFYLPHFFLLFDNKYKAFFSKDYLEKADKNWESIQFSHFYLKSALFRVTHFRLLYLMDQYGQTNEFYEELISNSLFPNSSLKLKIYRYLDYSMYRLGYYDRSLKIVRDLTLPLTKKYSTEKTLLSIKITQATYLYNIGKIKEAQAVFEEVIIKAKEKNIQLPEAIIFNNLALAYYKIGRYDRYLELQQSALETAKNEANYDHQIEIYNNLYIYYKNSNNKGNALSYLDKAGKLAEKENNKLDLGKIYTSIGSYYFEFEKKIEKAQDYFSKAKKVLDPKNNAKAYIDLLKVEEKIYKEKGKFDRALKIHDEIINISSTDNNRNYIDALVNKALIYLKIGNLAKVEELIRKYKEHDLSKLNFEQLIKAKTVEADYLQRTGQSREALNIIEPALDQVVVRAKGSADLTSGFWHVEDEYLDAFELAVSIYRKIGHPEKAIEKLDQLKTINNASLYQNPLVKSSLLNESELTQYKRLTNQLDATRKRLLTAPESQHFEIRQTISKLKLKKRKLDKKLTKKADSNPISVREVQNRLSAGELVLHITELNDRYYLAKISRSNVTIDTISLDSRVRNLLSSSMQQVSTHETNLDSLYEVSKILGLRDIPGRIEKVTLIPDSYFYQLPIDILPLNKPSHSYSYGEVTYAIEKFQTQYLTSLDGFKSDNSNGAHPQNELSYVGYGVSNFSGYNKESLVPLPFAQSEVTTIANELTNLEKVQTFINQQSTKTTFTHTTPQARIIHLATHSEVSERDPMFSTFYMSKTSPSADSTFEDQVFAYELFELDLSNEMIMLNSCDSGSGSYIQGTGVMGISRALQYAGAGSLILNLWSVNDMLASDFAIHFYGQLNQGKSKAEALRNTKRYFLRTKNASPHFWGPYMLIGNSDPVVEPHRNANLAMAGIFLLYFMLMIGLSYCTQKGIIFKGWRD